MSSLGTRVAWEVLRTIDSSTFTGAYQAIGSPLLHNCYLVKIVNMSGVDIVISDDGVNDKDVVPAGGFFLYDECSNASREGGLSVHLGTQFYVKASASIGIVYLVAQYVAT
jgi:hypothetical protein